MAVSNQPISILNASCYQFVARTSPASSERTKLSRFFGVRPSSHVSVRESASVPSSTCTLFYGLVGTSRVDRTIEVRTSDCVPLQFG
jgi:hypothetical protein